MKLAKSGHKIVDQKAAWQSVENKSRTAWGIIQIGVNDLNPADATSAAIERLQDLVNTIRNDVLGSAGIVISQITPVRRALIAVYGATDGIAAYQKWLDMNEAIAGNGPTPIVGVDGRITAHQQLMNDGLGNLKTEYDTGDGAHPNNDGRMVNAEAWESALSQAGITI